MKINKDKPYIKTFSKTYNEYSQQPLLINTESFNQIALISRFAWHIVTSFQTWLLNLNSTRKNTPKEGKIIQQKTFLIQHENK